IYDPQTNTWTSGPPLPTPRSGLAGTLYQGLILVLGGELPPSTTFTENEGFDVKANTWKRLAPMPAGPPAPPPAGPGRQLYLAGGSLTPGGAGATNQTIAFTLP